MKKAVDARSKALSLLSRREHSRSELKQKLYSTDSSSDEINTLLDEFENAGWLSDARFASSYVRANLERFGASRLKNELRQRGVSDGDIQAALAEATEIETDLSRAQTIWQKKFAAPPLDAADKGRQVRFLQARGFSFDVIRQVISGVDET